MVQTNISSKLSYQRGSTGPFHRHLLEPTIFRSASWVVSSSGFGENKNFDVDPGLYIYTFFTKKKKEKKKIKRTHKTGSIKPPTVWISHFLLGKMNKQKEEVGRESKKRQESMGGGK